MTQHDLKTHPQALRDVVEGRKPFEIRRNDRDFKVGDTLRLKEFNPETETFTRDTHDVLVTFIQPGGQYGVPADHVIMTVAPRWKRDRDVHKLLAQATSDPGAYAGFKGDRSMGQWMADAAILALRDRYLLAPMPDDVAVARAQGRAEALAILMATDAETFPDNYMGSHSIADTGDYGAHWEEAPLRELLKADISAWSLTSAAEGEYWAGLGHNDDTAALNKKLRETVDSLRSAGGDAETLVFSRFSALMAALTPSPETKAAYLGEVKIQVERAGEDDLGEPLLYANDVPVTWDAIKDLLKLILRHAISLNLATEANAVRAPLAGWRLIDDAALKGQEVLAWTLPPGNAPARHYGVIELLSYDRSEEPACWTNTFGEPVQAPSLYLPFDKPTDALIEMATTLTCPASDQVEA